MSVTVAQDPVQERTPAALAAGIGKAGACLALLLGGCSAQSSMNPVDWWHELEGGPISEARPPPPNADAPYPSLASVPARPTSDAASLRSQISTRLLSDRASATYAAAQAPLTAPPAAPAAPPPAATPPSQETEPLGAKLQAATAPPPSPPAPAMTPPAAPVPPPASTPPPPAAAPPAASMPPIPSGPPLPPDIPGVAISARTAPSPPPVPPPAPPPSVVPVSTAAVSVPFAGDSATLSLAAQTALRQLAQRRGTAAIAVTGYGEAASSDASDQAAALPLAWARAQAIAGALQSDGVPSAMLRLTAEAAGRGGVAAIAD